MPGSLPLVHGIAAAVVEEATADVVVLTKLDPCVVELAAVVVIAKLDDSDIELEVVDRGAVVLL